MIEKEGLGHRILPTCNNLQWPYGIKQNGCYYKLEGDYNFQGLAHFEKSPLPSNGATENPDLADMNKYTNLATETKRRGSRRKVFMHTSGDNATEAVHNSLRLEVIRDNIYQYHRSNILSRK